MSVFRRDKKQGAGGQITLVIQRRLIKPCSWSGYVGGGLVDQL